MVRFSPTEPFPSGRFSLTVRVAPVPVMLPIVTVDDPVSATSVDAIVKLAFVSPVTLSLNVTVKLVKSSDVVGPPALFIDRIRGATR